MLNLLKYSGLMLSVIAFPSWAMIEKHYVATPEQSHWNLTEDTPLSCRLVHPIPNYGNAEFSARASKKLNLDFELKMWRPMARTRSVSLVSLPAPWQAGEAAQRLQKLEFFQQFDGYVGGQTPWVMLSELERGRQPTFSYQEWQDRDQRIEISLSSVLFQQSYNQFSRCLQNLLPYSFEDIAFTILHYERQGDKLTKASRKRLDQIAQYLKYNQDIDLVLVSAYLDSSLGKDESQDLTERRAQSLRDYFKTLGLPEDRIEAQGFGKRRPIADNASSIGKDQNRRVVISFGRSGV